MVRRPRGEESDLDVCGWPFRAALVGEFYAERNREYPLRAGDTGLGRSEEATLRIPDERVADLQARVTSLRGSHVLEVLSGEAPTRLNDERLEAGDRRTLKGGDRIRLAGFALRFDPSARRRGMDRMIVTKGVHRGKLFRLGGPTVSVGRAPENGIQFPDRFVSRRHCMLRRRADGWWVRDLGSTNGTWVRGSAARSWRRIEGDDEVEVGYSRFRIADLEEEPGER